MGSISWGLLGGLSTEDGCGLFGDRCGAGGPDCLRVAARLKKEVTKLTQENSQLREQTEMATTGVLGVVQVKWETGEGVGRT